MDRKISESNQSVKKTEIGDRQFNTSKNLETEQRKSDSLGIPQFNQIKQYNSFDSPIRMTKSNSLIFLPEVELAENIELSKISSVETELSVFEKIPKVHQESTNETSERRLAISKKKTAGLRKLGGKKRDKHFYTKKNKRDIAHI